MKDERKFVDVVKSVTSSEKDVDKILEAARLARNEGPSTKLTGSQKMELIFGAMILVGFLGFFGFIAFACVI